MNKIPTNITLRGLFLLVTGAAVAFWLWKPQFKEFDASNHETWIGAGAVLLGGLALVGVPLLLVHRRKDRRRWGPGRILWFATSSASWLLWPPIVVQRARNETEGSISAICYLYGTPLMALWVMTALVAGGWVRPKRRKRVPLPWTERFGLLLGFLWACLGLYVLVYLIYGTDFAFRRNRSDFWGP